MSKKTGPRGKVDPKEFYKDSPVSGQKPEDLLASARIRVLMEHPFWGKIAQHMALIETERVPTTAVDANGRLYYNPKWVNHMRIEDAEFEFAHEVGHLYQRCFAMKPEGAIHSLWNKAADWRVDTDLIDAGMKQSKISKIAVDENAQNKVRELGVTPAIYKWMLQEAEDTTDCPACKQLIKNLLSQKNQLDKENQTENEKINNGNSESNESEQQDEGSEEKDCCNGQHDEDSDETCESNAEGGGKGSSVELEHTCDNPRMCCVGSTADLNQMDPADQQKWTEIIISAKMYAEERGKMPGHIAEEIDKLTKSVVRWQDYLKSRSSKIFGRDRYSFKRYNRRGFAINVRLPRAMPDGKTAVVACDTSGSMSREACVQSITEAAHIMKVCGASKLWLILHDAVAYYSGYVTEEALTKLKMSRGGTSHEDVFQILNREYSNEEFNIPPDEEVELAILFTDLGTCFPDKTPEFEVIWGVPHPSCPGMETDVPFGTKVPVPLDEK